MGITIRRLPDTELEVMQAIWACESPAARTAVRPSGQLAKVPWSTSPHLPYMVIISYFRRRHDFLF